MEIIFHLFLTIALELLVYSFADHFKLKSFLALLIGNLLLNFTMNTLATQMTSYSSYFFFLLGAEIFTFITEAFLFYLFTDKKLWFCFVVSFNANILSLAVGNIFNQTGLIYKNGVVIPVTVVWIVIILAEFATCYALWLKAYIKKLYSEKH